MTSKAPKTFLIFVTNKYGNTGYIRYKSTVSSIGKIHYEIILTEKVKDASRFVSGENTKNKARKLKERFKFRDVEVIDETIKRRYVI